MRKLVGLFAGATILVAACGGTSTSSPSAAAPSTPAQSQPAASPSASGEAPSSSPAAIDLFGSTYKAEEPTQQGGTIIIGDWQEANQFNPYYLGQVTEANVASIVWHSLLTISSDFRYLPQLAAEPIPTTENGGVKAPGDGGDAMTVTWKLRDGLKWSDGQPLTCDDFKYAWEWVLDKANVGVITSGFEDIKNFECASDTDMIWHFDKIYEGYLTLMTAPLPRHYLSKIPIKDQVNGAGFRANEIAKMPVPGPFKYESVTAGAELRLAKNDQYANPRTGKPANLDTIIFKWYGDPDAMIAGFRNNEIDLAFDLTDSDIGKVEDLGPVVQAIPALDYEVLRLNWSPASDFDAAKKTGGCSRNPAIQDRGTGCPTADPAIREAIAYAINKDEINQRLLSGNAIPATGAVSPSIWYYAPQQAPGYDPAKAKQVLADGGWKDTDGDGIVEKDGLKAKVELCTSTRQVRQDTLALISSWLKAVGIDSIVSPVDAGNIFADPNSATLDMPCALVTSNWDLAEHAFSSAIDPLGNYFSYHSSQFPPEGANHARVSDPDLDKALDDVKNNVDFAVIQHAMARFQEIYVEKTVEIPLYYRRKVELVTSRLGNYRENGTQAGSVWNAEDWFLGS